MSDDALKFVVQVVNGDAVKDLTAQIDKQKKVISELNDAFLRGKLTDDQFGASALNAGQKIATATRSIRELETASSSSARGILQLGYAVDDLQYGFSSIVNNIPQVVMGLGGGAGIAGAVGIAVVAVNQLMKHWGELTSMLQAAWEGGSAERIRVLAERAEEAAKAFDKMAAAGTSAERGGAAAFGAAVQDAGTEKIRKALTDTLLATGGGAALGAFESEKARDARTRAAGFGGAATTGGVSEEDAKKAQYAATAKIAADLLGQAQQPGEAGRAARDRINRAIKANPGAFDEEFRAKFEASDPDKQREIEQRRLDAAGARNARKDEEKAKDKSDKLADVLNRAGQENQAFGENRLQKQRVQDLQDKRDLIMEQRGEAAKAVAAANKVQPTQILSGAKAALDMYQKAAGDQTMIAQQKRANDLLMRLDDKLRDVNAELRKQQRVTPA